MDDGADSWAAVASDLRGTLARTGVSEAVVERVFAAIAPAVAALERQRGAVEPELLWALIVVAAASFQRTQPQCERRFFSMMRYAFSWLTDS